MNGYSAERRDMYMDRELDEYLEREDEGLDSDDIENIDEDNETWNKIRSTK